MTTPLHLAVALDGTGWHPAAWRLDDSRPTDIFSLRYWTALVRRAEAAGIDLATFEDALGLQGSGRRGRELQGRLDALLIASAVAPRTSTIGLVPTVTTTHTEPFHVATGLATLDHVSHGRAGWRVQVSGRPQEADHFGRRTLAPIDAAASAAGDPEQVARIEALFGEAREAVEVARLLWDSWEDDAVIRDTATGRFIDRNRLHYADFEGEHFSVKGPSITPRPPQGQLPVFALAHQEVPYRFAATSADIVGITPQNDDELTAIIDRVRAIEAEVGRAYNPSFREPLRIWGEIVVLIEDSTADAAAALRHLNDLRSDEDATDEYTSDALILADTAEAVASTVKRWHALGVDGVRLRPARLPRDLDAIADRLLPLLRTDGLLERPVGETSLRGRLGFDTPTNRFTNLDRVTA